MSTVEGSRNIVTNNLILCLDAANTRSYPTTGTTWFDLSKSIQNSTLVNNPTFDSGNGGSILLNGTGDYIEVISDGKNSIFEVQDFTIDIWYYYTQNGLYEILWSYNAPLPWPTVPYYSQHFRTVTEAGYVDALFVGYNLGGVYNYKLSTIGIPVVNRDSWNHLVWTRNSNGQLRVYCNGNTIITDDSVIGNISYYNRPIWIGVSDFVSALTTGRFAEVKFYNRALSQTEVLQNYNVTRNRFGI
jgi:hypothetical protein